MRMGQPPVLGVGAEEQLMERRSELNKIMADSGALHKSVKSSGKPLGSNSGRVLQ